MDEPYLLAAARSVERNPQRAGLVVRAADWRWSSAAAHLSGRDDDLMEVAPLLAMARPWRALLDSTRPERDLRDHARTGRPLGGVTFLERLEALVDRVLRQRKPGRKQKFSKSPK